MCYKDPGPRCSDYARKQVLAAREEMNSAADGPEKDAARQRYRNALRMFYGTPAGFKEIERQIEDAKANNGDPQSIERWERRLERLKADRKASIAKSKGLLPESASGEHGETSVGQPLHDASTMQESQWVRCEACGQFAGADHVCEAGPYDPENIQTWTPAQVDDKAAELLYQSYALQAKIDQYEVYRDDYKSALDPNNRFRYREYDVSRNEEKVAEYEAKIADLRKQKEALREESKKYEDEYERRGRWTRAFIVTNANGHVHSSMDCSTCRLTTQYAWLTEYSGKDEDEIVSDAGERACTVCYPSAPVEVRESATKIFTPQEKEAKRARAEREAKRAAREAKKAAGRISNPDGSPLVLHNARWSDEIRTEREAQIRYVENMASLRLIEEGKWDGAYYDSERKREHVKILEAALKNKKGMSDAEFAEFVEPKIKAKMRTLLKG